VERDDAALLCASVRDPERFELIFERHHAAVWRFLARRGGRERADEIAGDVFVTAFACRDRFDPGRGSVEAWLYGIASNRLRTRLRSDARAARAFRRAAAEQLVEVAPVDGAGDALDDRRRLGEVLSALARMSAVDREIITLFAWERLSYEEIASVVGVEVGTVRSRLSRARSRLRELVSPAGEARGDDRS
jgi:RNA polymerase sigma-70 factor (ECF subfamily)